MFRWSARLTLIFSVTSLLAALTPAISAGPVMPLEKGDSWTYEGRVEWEEEGAVVRSKRIRLTAEIVDVFDVRNARVAVVRGFPSELAWYDDNSHPGYFVLIVTRRGVYEQQARSQKEAYRFAREFGQKPESLLRLAGSILSYPSLTPKRSPCEKPRFHLRGFNAAGRMKCERIVYRTNPDITIIEFVRGLGVVSYYYKHFGTVSLADVKLREVRFANGKR